MGKLDVPVQVAGGAAEAAIAAVLDAERAARADIERSLQQSLTLAEQARADARALSARTERRIRRITAAFESALTAQTTKIRAQALALAEPLSVAADESAAVERAVTALARELTTTAP